MLRLGGYAGLLALGVRGFWLWVCIVPGAINAWQPNMAELQPHDTHTLGALLDLSLKPLQKIQSPS